MVAQSIFDRAERAPNARALIYDERTLTYRELADRIVAARRFFMRAGLGGDGVAILAMGNLLDFWTFSPALRDLGLTTLAARSAQELATIGLPDVRCVIASPTEPWAGLEAACAARGWPLIVAHPDPEVSALAGGPRRAAKPGGHILQTSGTTGTHKMVLMDSAFEAAFLRRRYEDYGIDEGSVVNIDNFQAWTGAGYKSPASIWAAGGCALIRQWSDRNGPYRRPDLTHAITIPIMLTDVLAAPTGAYPRNDAVRIFVGGGAMPQTMADQVRERITSQLYVTVASTETSAFFQTRIETPEDRRWHEPMPNRGVELVDDLDRPVSLGQVGRVRVLADGPTGYLYDAETSLRFFRDGYFYPGDMAVARADGRMALQGRTTEVINLLGNKISPAPIEDALRERFGVSAVCLFSMQDEAGAERLHVVLETPRPLPADQLAAGLEKEIFGFPDARVHFVTGMPRNDMGKVRRDRLRELMFPATG